MSYDFCIEQIAVPLGAKFPLDMKTWGGADPQSKVIVIGDPEKFWSRLGAFPEMKRNGPPEDRTWSFYGTRYGGSGFIVYPVSNWSGDAMRDLNVWKQEVADDRLSVEERICRLRKILAESESHGLLGIKLDMAGSWYDVLELYKYMKAQFPLLVVLDQQTGSIHDEASFLRFIEER